MSHELKGSDLTRAMLARGDKKYGAQCVMKAMNKR